MFADYHQFYLQDELAETDTPNDWGEQLTTNLIAVDQAIVGISTARNKTVPVRIDLLATRPVGDDFDNWDHVAEASLEISSGQIVISGCSDYFPKAKRLSIEPGCYRVRAYYGGLNTLNWNSLEGDDHYQVVLWPDGYKPIQILKRWSDLDND